MATITAKLITLYVWASFIPSISKAKQWAKWVAYYDRIAFINAIWVSIDQHCSKCPTINKSFQSAIDDALWISIGQLSFKWLALQKAFSFWLAKIAAKWINLCIWASFIPAIRSVKWPDESLTNRYCHRVTSINTKFFPISSATSIQRSMNSSITHWPMSQKS